MAVSIFTSGASKDENAFNQANPEPLEAAGMVWIIFDWFGGMGTTLWVLPGLSWYLPYRSDGTVLHLGGTRSSQAVCIEQADHDSHEGTSQVSFMSRLTRCWCWVRGNHNPYRHMYDNGLCHCRCGKTRGWWKQDFD